MTTIDTRPNSLNDIDVEVLYIAGCEYAKKKEYIKALYYYQRAVEQGHTGAMNKLGLMYCNQRFLKPNYKEAERLIRMAIEGGQKEAQFSLVCLYMVSQTEDEHYEEVVDICKRLAEEGHADAMNHLADLYALGKGVEENYEEALRLYKQAIEGGSASAMYTLGMEYYYWHVLVEADEEEGCRLFEKAASLGNLDAMFMLAWVSEQEADYDEAFKRYCEVAEHEYAEAQFQLAYNYHVGNEIDINLKKAEQFYKLAAQQGEGAAYNNLAVLYASTNDPKKLQEAEGLFKKYVDNEYMTKHNLAQLYQMLGKKNKAKKLRAELENFDRSSGEFNANFFVVGFDVKRANDDKKAMALSQAEESKRSQSTYRFLLESLCKRLKISETFSLYPTFK